MFFKNDMSDKLQPGFNHGFYNEILRVFFLSKNQSLNAKEVYKWKTQQKHYESTPQLTLMESSEEHTPALCWTEGTSESQVQLTEMPQQECENRCAH